MIKYINKISEEDYNHLRISAGWRKIESTQAETGIKNAAFLVAAVYNEKTIGMARLIWDGGYAAMIVDVIVLPEFQRNGIGKNMVQKIMEYITENLQEGQSVYLNLIAAKGKEKFYSQFGFFQCPNDNTGCGMTQWITK